MTHEPFPIRLDDDIRTVPWGVFDGHDAQADANHGASLFQLAERGGLTPEEAVAIVEDRPFCRMPATAATLQLKTHVERFLRGAGNGVFQTPVPASSCPTLTTSLSRLSRGAALARAMQKRVNRDTHLHANYAELIRIMEDASLTIRAYGTRLEARK